MKLRYRKISHMMGGMENDTSAKRGRGRPVEYPERLPGPRLPEGTEARLKAQLHSGEGPGEFMRHAILAEIERREKDAE